VSLIGVSRPVREAREADPVPWLQVRQRRENLEAEDSLERLRPIADRGDEATA
jgi:hypothetical protein